MRWIARIFIVRWIARVFILLLASAACSCTMWENPAKGWAGATGGEQLERQFWMEIAAQNWKELEKHLAPNFIAVATTGTYPRDAALQHWKDLRLLDYSLGEFEVEPNGTDMVVTYTAVLRGTLNGRPLPAGPVRVMSVWQDVQSRWMMIAHSTTPAAP